MSKVFDSTILPKNMTEDQVLHQVVRHLYIDRFANPRETRASYPFFTLRFARLFMKEFKVKSE